MPASFLKIGGELVQDAILQLVEVTQELNQHWWCRVECRQTEDQRIPVENLLGQDLQIVTRDQAGAEHVVFDGFVLEASLLYEVFGSYTARLKAVTRSYKLDLTAQEAYYRKKTLTDVAQSLASADGLTADVLAKDGLKRNYVQWGDADFRFLVRIADDHQAWIRPTAQGIQICDTFQRGAQVTWRQEDGLLSFDVEGALATPAFDGTHSDARQMRSVTHTAVSKPAEHFGSSGPMVTAVERQSKALLLSGAAFLDNRAATAEEYKALLERESLRAAGNRVAGHGISQKEDLKAGDTVEIDGVLDGKGTYGLTKVIHRWTAQGYENEFWCTTWKNYVSPQLPEPSEVAGVVTARVVDHNDPRKMGRIQVQYDWQESGPTGWVRATAPHAGQDRGFLFMPEIGDEVVVAFEHGDPERPYVVGYLWNGVDQAPRDEFWGEDIDPNDVKRIVTKSGHRIQFVDKPGKESIVIATPQHLKISLIEKTDETGRSIILLHSDGDIFINASGGRVHFHCSTLSQDVGGSGEPKG
jgi:type VI secretion system secreted protein VgrG